tara:strand:+ start:181 stop:1146 length:966 start_codon:yes stop_codon:yes gene_type:complete
MFLDKKKLFKIKGDASFREFYRKKIKSKSSIIIFSKKEKKKNLLIYDAINKVLIQNKLFAPKLLNEKYDLNFIEVNDFGKVSALDYIKKNKNKLMIFKKIVELLIKLQTIRTRKIRNFKKKLYNIPIYSNELLLNEAKLFCDWYVPENIKKGRSKINKKLKIKIKNLLNNLKLKNNVFVHRDFHVSNLMLFKKKLAIIDTQDAAIGNLAYDLASLVDDVRYETSNSFKKKIYDLYFKKNKKNLNKTYFLNDFEILSVLRNLKIIGIFTRLAKRDKKLLYLKLIPYTWKLIDLRCQNNKLLKNLRAFLFKKFPKNVRNKYAN